MKEEKRLLFHVLKEVLPDEKKTSWRRQSQRKNAGGDDTLEGVRFGPDGHIVGLDFQNWQLGSTDISKLEALLRADCVEHLDLSYNPNLHGNVQILQKCSGVVELKLGDTSIVGNLSALNLMQDLVRLGLSSTTFQGDLAAMDRHERLEELYLMGTQVMGDVASLKSCPKLRIVNLDGTDCTGKLDAFARAEGSMVSQLALDSALALL